MATKYINSITYGGNEYKLVDNSSVFVAEYNSTTYNDLLAAYNAGKVIILKVNNSRYGFLQSYYSTQGFNFSALVALNSQVRWTLSPEGVWSSGSLGISNTTYSLSISGSRITLTPSSGTATYVDLPIYDGSVE